MNVFEAARQADCVRAAEYLGMEIHRSGSRRYVRCLFHSEKTPSMCLYPGDGGFYCFGCHAHGDAIRLYQQACSLPPLEAAKRICRDFGFRYDAGGAWRTDTQADAPGRPAADARALARRLERERERRAAYLLEIIRAAQLQMEAIQTRMLDEGKGYEDVCDDAIWSQLLIERTAAQEELAALDSMSLADVLSDLRASAQHGAQGKPPKPHESHANEQKRRHP